MINNQRPSMLIDNLTVAEPFIKRPQAFFCFGDTLTIAVMRFSQFAVDFYLIIGKCIDKINQITDIYIRTAGSFGFVHYEIA